MDIPIYKLVINENDETGVEFVSLVTSPAIERDFVYFNKEAFFNDYPKAASQNAQRGINLNEKVGNDCATLVGKNRARQLVANENLSIETIKRTYSYLSRAKEYYNPNDTEACGTISYLLWGGEEMLRWTERKLEELEMKKARKKFEIQNAEKRIIFGMAMEADKNIYRYDDIRGEYYVYFDADTIFEIAKKWARGDRYDSVNLQHSDITKGLSLFESYIVDRKRGKLPPQGYEDVADGSWFLSYIVNDDEVWAKVKSGEFKGFSVEGYFDFEETEEDKVANAMMSKLKRIIENWDGKN